MALVPFRTFQQPLLEGCFFILKLIQLNTSTKSWYSKAARVGLIAKGSIYCLSGIIALMAATEFGNNKTGDAGKRGVFNFIEDQPFGKWLLLAVAIGMACYTFWRWMQAFKDTEDNGSDKKGLAKRFTYFFSGLVYASLSLYAFREFMGAANSKGDSRQSLVATLLDKPFGAWLVGIIGLSMIGIGVYQLFRAMSGKYKKYVQKGLHNDTAKWIISAGVAGYSARGIVWLIIGWLFIKAALHANPKEVGGSDTAFQWLHDSSYGSVLLAAVALGLICYGIFMLLRAKYQSV